MQNFWASLFLTLTLSSNAHASLDSLSGVRVSVAAIQKAMAAQPLPSMNSNKSVKTIQASYFLIEMAGKDSATSNQYNGDFTGNVFSLGYSSELRARLGHYITAFYNRFTGTAQGEDPSVGQHDFVTTGGAITGGYSYRLYGKDDSKLSVGVFGGPTLMHFSNKLTVGEEVYNSNPFIYGAQVGMQIKLKLNALTLIPYGIYMQEFSEQCKKVSSSAAVAPGEGCTGKSASADATFAAAGLVIGYKRIQFNVYSEVWNDEDTYKDLTMWDFALSYSW